ncbi:MAG: cytochrome P450 [Actinobacteria bacterium]|nr:cytochrome P450 [Actinomycetota bacterium]
MERKPVSDWATDFDIFDPEFVADPFPVFADLRERCPVAHTDRSGGQWMPVTYEHIAEITADTDHFSSVTVGVTGRKPGEGAILTAPPITSDPPEHAGARRVLLPSFSPKAVERLTPLTRDLARRLIVEIRESGDDVVDAADRYARHIPVLVIATMLGVPLEDEERFTDWAVRVLQIGLYDLGVGQAAAKEVLEYFKGHVEARRADPAPHEDLIADLMAAELDGAPLTDRHILGSAFLLLVAGIDTTWSSIGSSLLHLATHPEDRRRLVAEPELIPTAIEEFLRVYAPVTMARIVKEDTTVGGCPMHAGDRVLLSFPAANRDPALFEAPEEVRIDREVNRHAAFGLGIHRCVGSNLARMELQVALTEWLAAFPEFSLVEGAELEWTGGQTRGPRSVPVHLG